MRRMIAISVLALFSTIAGNAQAQAQQANLQKLNVAYAFVATATTPLWIAEDEGLFKKNGLEIKMILFQGSAAATQTSR